MLKDKIREPEIIMSICAIFLSLLAVAVALFEASIAREQQKSSVWPYLEVLSSNVDGLSLFVSNKGLGPAKIEDFRVMVDGKFIQSWRQWLESLDPEFKWYITKSQVNGRVLSPGEVLEFIKLTPDVMSRLAELKKEGIKISREACYCSVYQDCWITSGIDSRPVDECKADEKKSFRN